MRKSWFRNRIASASLKKGKISPKFYSDTRRSIISKFTLTNQKNPSIIPIFYSVWDAPWCKENQESSLIVFIDMTICDQSSSNVCARWSQLPFSRCKVGHKDHDRCFHKEYKVAGVMTFVAHCTRFYVNLVGCRFSEQTPAEVAAYKEQIVRKVRRRKSIYFANEFNFQRRMSGPPTPARAPKNGASFLWFAFNRPLFAGQLLSPILNRRVSLRRRQSIFTNIKKRRPKEPVHFF